MHLRDALSERMVFGTFAFIVYGAFGGMVLSGFSASKGVTDSVVGFIVGAASSSLVNVIQSTFRTDRAEEKRAETTQQAVQALATSTPGAAPAPGTTTTTTTTTDAVPDPVASPIADATPSGTPGDPVSVAVVDEPVTPRERPE